MAKQETTKRVVALRPMRGPSGSLVPGDIVTLDLATAKYLENCKKVTSDEAALEAAEKAAAKAKPKAKA